MTAPLTHHDIIRHAAQLTRRGLRVNIDLSDRQARVVVFHVRQLTPAASLQECYSLSVLSDDGVELCRAVGDDSGLIATLTARADSLESLIDVFFEMDTEQLLVRGEHHALALSYTVEPLSGDVGGAHLQLQQMVGRCDQLELRTDVSTTFGMPADTVLLDGRDTHSHLKKKLANGATVPEATLAAKSLASSINNAPGHGDAHDASSVSRARFKPQDVPDDLLALLGAQWRPLIWQGGYWKTVLRQLGTEPGRSSLAREHGISAMMHLAAVKKTGPTEYHRLFAPARQRAWLRRLRPLMLLMAILATAPAFWAATKFTGFTLHPMAMGLTPLLLMGVVMMTSREFPIMELPAFPRALSARRWVFSKPDACSPASELEHTQTPQS